MAGRHSSPRRTAAKVARMARRAQEEAERERRDSRISAAHRLVRELSGAGPSVCEETWAGLSGPERSRLEQAGVTWDSGAGVMRDAETGTQVSVGEVRALLERQGVRKAGIAGLEAERGPGTSMQPGKIEPEDFRRPYVEADHAARSPLAEPPRVSPLPPRGRGILEPLPQSAVAHVVGGGPAAGLAAHQARVNATSPVIPVPSGSA
jgi:hypothetical protein